MTDDLKTRLRWAADSSDGCGEWNCDPADLYAAADRIEELEDKLKKAVDFIEDLTGCEWPYDEDAKRILAELTGDKP